MADPGSVERGVPRGFFFWGGAVPKIFSKFLANLGDFFLIFLRSRGGAAGAPPPGSATGFALMSNFSIAKPLICIYLIPLLSLLYPLRACTFTFIDRCPIKSTHFYYTYIQCYTYIGIFENVVLS